METREALKVVYISNGYGPLTKVNIDTMKYNVVDNRLSAGYLYMIPEDGSILSEGNLNDVKKGDVILTISTDADSRVVVIKSKELEDICQEHLAKVEKRRNTESTIKPQDGCCKSDR